MKRRRLAALSEHMESRLVLSPLLGMPSRAESSTTLDVDADNSSTSETQTPTVAEVTRDDVAGDRNADAQETQPTHERRAAEPRASDPSQGRTNSQSVAQEDSRTSSAEPGSRTDSLSSIQPSETTHRNSGVTTATTPVEPQSSNENFVAPTSREIVTRDTEASDSPVTTVDQPAAASAEPVDTTERQVAPESSPEPATGDVVTTVDSAERTSDPIVVADEGLDSDRVTDLQARPVTESDDAVSDVRPVFDEMTGGVRLALAVDSAASVDRVITETRPETGLETRPIDSDVVERIAQPRGVVAVVEDVGRSTTEIETIRDAAEIVSAADRVLHDLDSDAAVVDDVSLTNQVSTQRRILNMVTGAAQTTTSETTDRLINEPAAETILRVTDDVVVETIEDVGIESVVSEVTETQELTDVSSVVEEATKTIDENITDDVLSDVDGEVTTLTEQVGSSASALASNTAGVTRHDGARELRLPETTEISPAVANEKATIAWTPFRSGWPAGYRLPIEFGMSTDVHPVTVQAEQSDEAAASQTVFGDATRLGIMLAAIQQAGRRSGSEVLFSIGDEDLRTESGTSASGQRRRRERTRMRGWEMLREGRRRGDTFFDTVDESSAIPCASTSVDVVFADSASMCVLFQGDGDEVETDLKTPLTGLLLGATGVAAHEISRRGGGKKLQRPAPPLPRYTGDTIVVTE